MNQNFLAADNSHNPPTPAASVNLQVTGKTAALDRFLAGRPLVRNGIFQPEFYDVDDVSEEIPENVAINRLVDRYENILRANKPVLCFETWTHLLNAFNGRTEHTTGEIESYSPFSAICDDHGLEMADHESQESFSKRVDETLGASVSDLLNLTLAEKMSVFEIIERYWGRQEEKDLDSFLNQVFGGAEARNRTLSN
jgi:hypothetical protein